MLKNSGVTQMSMGILLMHFQAFQKPAQLSVVNLKNICSIFWPSEELFFQSFVPQAKSVSIPVQNFYHILALVAEYKQVPGKWIHFQMFSHHNRQAVNGLAHICVTGCQEYPNM